jgi:hypothetical protein
MDNNNKEFYYLPHLKEVVDDVMYSLDYFGYLDPTREYVKCIDALLKFWGMRLGWEFRRDMERDNDPVLDIEYEEMRYELEEVKREWKEYKDARQI